MENIVESSIPTKKRKAGRKKGMNGTGGEPTIFSAEKPDIEVRANALPYMAEEVNSYLYNDIDLFSRDGELVSIFKEDGSPRLRPLMNVSVWASIQKVANWFVWERNENGESVQKIVTPPRPIAEQVKIARFRPDMRLIRGVVMSPVLRADGTILQEPGYDEASMVYHHKTVDMPTIAEHPTDLDITESIDILKEAVCDFPFAEEHHFSAWLAALLTPLARLTYRDGTPFFLFDAPKGGSGKGMLTDVIGIIVTGRPLVKSPFHPTEEEFRKAALGHLCAGSPIMVIDNITNGATFGYAILDGILTTGRWEDRGLGKNDIVSRETLNTWFGTGNNITLKTDSARRTLRITIDPPEARPEERSGWRHNPLLEWVEEMRPRLLRAALTILRAYFSAGRPDLRLPDFGSFTSWSRVVRHAIVDVGLPDPYLASALHDICQDEDVENHRILIEMLLPRLDEPTLVREVIDWARTRDADRVILCSVIPPPSGEKMPTVQQLAQYFAKVKGKKVNIEEQIFSLRPIRRPHNVIAWQIVEHPNTERAVDDNGR